MLSTSAGTSRGTDNTTTNPLRQNSSTHNNSKQDKAQICAGGQKGTTSRQMTGAHGHAQANHQQEARNQQTQQRNTSQPARETWHRKQTVELTRGKGRDTIGCRHPRASRMGSFWCVPHKWAQAPEMPRCEYRRVPLTSSTESGNPERVLPPTGASCWLVGHKAPRQNALFVQERKGAQA